MRQQVRDSTPSLTEFCSWPRQYMRGLFVAQAEYSFLANGTMSGVLSGLVDPQAVASPSIPSWNQMHEFLQEMRRLREAGIPAA